jgi:hypothetical protein
MAADQCCKQRRDYMGKIFDLVLAGHIGPFRAIRLQGGAKAEVGLEINCFPWLNLSNLNIDPIELVEACPCTSLQKTKEKLLMSLHQSKFCTSIDTTRIFRWI